ncbi:MAG: hypothetical protein M3N18_07690, partial [Actinomycetota bacterium]|nr:hypothetical protein [Actinomycetota bacterium]
GPRGAPPHPLEAREQLLDGVPRLAARSRHEALFSGMLGSGAFEAPVLRVAEGCLWVGRKRSPLEPSKDG